MRGEKAVGTNGADRAQMQLWAVERTVLVLDMSASMTETDYPPSRLQAAKNAALQFINRKVMVDDRDEVAIVAFSDTAKKKIPLRRLAKHREQLAECAYELQLEGSGGTAIGLGLLEGASILGFGSLSPGARKPCLDWVPRIVLLSDGENNCGLEPIAVSARLKAMGVVIDTVGIGATGIAKQTRRFRLDELSLQAIASPGRYRYIADSASLLRHFGGIADKVMDPVFTAPGASNARGTSVLATVADMVAALYFNLRWVHRLSRTSPLVGAHCVNERNEGMAFRQGDVVVVCPKCGAPHHKDCWAWNGGRCYGGDIPCPGKGGRCGRGLLGRGDGDK